MEQHQPALPRAVPRNSRLRATTAVSPQPVPSPRPPQLSGSPTSDTCPDSTATLRSSVLFPGMLEVLARSTRGCSLLSDDSRRRADSASESLVASKALVAHLQVAVSAAAGDISRGLLTRRQQSVMTFDGLLMNVALMQQTLEQEQQDAYSKVPCAAASQDDKIHILLISGSPPDTAAVHSAFLNSESPELPALAAGRRLRRTISLGTTAAEPYIVCSGIMDTYSEILETEQPGLASFAVQHVPSGEAALRVLEDPQGLVPDVVVLDAALPDGCMGWEEVVRRIRGVRSGESTGLAVVVLVMREQVEAAAQSLVSCQINDYVMKPLIGADVQARVYAQVFLHRVLHLKSQAQSTMVLLRNILPAPVIKRLISGQSMVAEMHQEVTILFSDLVGFTTLTCQLPTGQVVQLLHDLFTAFDLLCDKHGVFKVDTIGDAYMVVAGNDGEEDHATRMIAMAVDMLAATEEIQQAHPYLTVEIRVGVSTGPAHSGVVGLHKPKYTFWGDPVNTAARMESSSWPSCLQISTDTYTRLQAERAAKSLSDGAGDDGGRNSHVETVQFVPLGARHIKGKGFMETYLAKVGRYQEAVEAIRSKTSPYYSHSTCGMFPHSTTSTPHWPSQVVPATRAENPSTDAQLPVHPDHDPSLNPQQRTPDARQLSLTMLQPSFPAAATATATATALAATEDAAHGTATHSRPVQSLLLLPPLYVDHDKGWPRSSTSRRLAGPPLADSRSGSVAGRDLSFPRACTFQDWDLGGSMRHTMFANGLFQASAGAMPTSQLCMLPKVGIAGNPVVIAGAGATSAGASAGADDESGHVDVDVAVVGPAKTSWFKRGPVQSALGSSPPGPTALATEQSRPPSQILHKPYKLKMYTARMAASVDDPGPAGLRRSQQAGEHPLAHPDLVEAEMGATASSAQPALSKKNHGSSMPAAGRSASGAAGVDERKCGVGCGVLQGPRLGLSSLLRSCIGGVKGSSSSSSGGNSNSNSSSKTGEVGEAPAGAMRAKL